MVDLAGLARQIDPKRTVLFLGAGASVPSGAPTAEELARYLEDTLAHGSRMSTNFAELCSLLEQRYSRSQLVQAVRNRLQKVVPTGGLLALPGFGWHSIYTTNYDRLVELAYSQSKIPLIPVRSNFDYGKLDNEDGTPLFKLHGCISEDVVDGASARMVLTEIDNELSTKYRELLFKRLEFEMSSHDVLILGYSLRDASLAHSLKEAARLHQEAGTPGKLLALVYERDEARAALMEARGITVAFGGVDELFHELTQGVALGAMEVSPSTSTVLMPSLHAATVDVSHAEAREPNVKRMFNGSAADYGDIRAGYTFERSVEFKLLEMMKENLCISLVGAAGVGKTTLARRLLFKSWRSGLHAWEHRSEFNLRSANWLVMASSLSNRGERGVLFVNDSPAHQREVNTLLDDLASSGLQSLKIILVGERSQWAPRTKSPAIFKFGHVEILSKLDLGDLNRLLNLSELAQIRELVEPQFRHRSRAARLEYLRQRCSADMFVALKNIFASELMDNIILREYAALAEVGLGREQAIYKNIAGLDVAGVKVHRQFLVRMLGISAGEIRRVLEVLEGIVEEYDIASSDGLYGWRTRHPVISEILSRYKFQDPSERLALFQNAINNMNPALPLEARSLKDLCVGHQGIRSLPNPSDRIALYSQLVDLMPWERVPRHRLFKEYLDEQDLGAADHCLRTAFEVVGFDPPLQRYKVLLLIARARQTQGLMQEDRRALLMQAWDIFKEGVERQRSDKYAYLVGWDVAKAFAEVIGDLSYVDPALVAIQLGYEKLLDPDLERRLRNNEIEATRLMTQGRPS